MGRERKLKKIEIMSGLGHCWKREIGRNVFKIRKYSTLRGNNLMVNFH